MTRVTKSAIYAGTFLVLYAVSWLLSYTMVVVGSSVGYELAWDYFKAGWLEDGGGEMPAEVLALSLILFAIGLVPALFLLRRFVKREMRA